MTYNEACRAIIKHQHEPALNWAVNYAKTGVNYESDSEAARVQALYILNNMSRWRGDVAKEARAAFKKTAGVK